MGRVYRPKRKQKDGSTWTSPRYYVEYYDEHHRQKRLPASTSRKKSLDLLTELESQASRIRNGLEVAKPRTPSPTISELVTAFRADMKHHLTASTQKVYEDCLKDLFEGGLAGREKPWIKAKLVEELTPKKIADFQTQAVKVMSKRSVTKRTRVLSAFLNWCVRQQRIEQNPLGKIRHIPDRPEAPLRAMEDEEVKKLLEVSPPDVATCWIILLDTALRKGELAQLTWKDLDLDRRTLTVRPATTKTHRSRTIPLTKRVVELLRPMREGKQLLDKSPHDLVVPTIGNYKSFYDGAYPIFKRLCKKAGIDLTGLNVHSLRRTCATKLLTRGASPKSVQAILGHATPYLTLQLYAKIRQDDLQNAIDTLDE